jgi:hypothetical protein
MSNREADMGLERPGRFGSGTYMTVAIVPRSVWLGKPEEQLSIESVIDRLHRYEMWLANLIQADGKADE